MLKSKSESGRLDRLRRSANGPVLLLAAIGGGGMVMPSAAQAQREIVQPLPPPEIADLRRALTRLASEPRNVDALIEAGNASLALNDVDAAIGFFGRAESLDAGNPRVKLGLAGAHVLARRPIEALRLFDEAERAGADVAPFAAQRGLAFDLVGDNASAQAQYRLALARRDDPQVREKLAISHAVSGDRRSFEATLLPLLEARDMGAYRTRAFGLAILDRGKEAADLAKAVMPPALAEALIPYLRQMPQLSAVEQVAAVHLGVFPASSRQGSATTVAAARPAAAGASSELSRRMTPAGEPLGASSGRLRGGASSRSSGPDAAVPPASTAQPAASPASVSAATPPATVQPVAQSARPAVAQPQPGAVQLPSPPQPVRPDLDTLFAGLTPSSTASPTPGAVDVTRLAVRRDPPPAPKSAPATSDRPAPKPAAKPAAPPKPAHPARVWVQLAAGANRDAFAFDWRRMAKTGGDALRGKEPHVAEWGRSHRLLVGPYPSAKAADEAVRALRDAGLDSFRYQSPEGQEVTRLK